MFTWSEFETRAFAFQKRLEDCARDEKQDFQTFEVAFSQTQHYVHALKARLTDRFKFHVN